MKKVVAFLSLFAAAGLGFALGRLTGAQPPQPEGAAVTAPAAVTARERGGLQESGREDPHRVGPSLETPQSGAMETIASTAAPEPPVPSEAEESALSIEDLAGAETARAERLKRAEERMAFLSDVDCTGMGDTAQSRLVRLADATVALEETEQRLWAEDLSPEERDRLTQLACEKDREIAELAQKTRRDLLRRLAFRLGCPKEQVDEVANTIRAVYDLTDYQRLDDEVAP